MALAKGKATSPPAEEFLSDAVAVVPIPGKGRGLVATRRVELGELLFVARAFKVAPMATVVQEVAQALATAGAARRQAFAALDDGGDGSGEVCMEWFRPGAAVTEEVPSAALSLERVKRIVRRNGHIVTNMMKDGALVGSNASAASDSDSPELCGLWLLPSFLNHDCIPSVVCVPLDPETLACVAAAPLEEGDELTDSYINLLQSRADRQSELREQKGFTCCCGRCQSEASELPDEVAAAVMVRMQAAYQTDDADDFLRKAEEVRRHVAAALLATTPGTELRHMLRASLSVADVAVAMVYESTACSFRDKRALCAEACWELCQTLEQVAPLSAQHVHFAEKRFQNSEGDRSRQDALAYLFALWHLRRTATEAPAPRAPRAPGECRRLVEAFAEAQGLATRNVAKAALAAECEGGFGPVLDSVGVERFGKAGRLLAAKERPDRPALLRASESSQDAAASPTVGLDEMD